MPQQQREQRNIRRWLVRLTGPIFIEMVLIILLGTVDTVMLSQCSDNTVAAVGVVVQLLNMVFLAFEATTAGTSVLCSQYLGARQTDNVSRTIGVSLLFNAMMGVVVSSGLFFGAGLHPLDLLGALPRSAGASPCACSFSSFSARS